MRIGTISRPPAASVSGPYANSVSCPIANVEKRIRSRTQIRETVCNGPVTDRKPSGHRNGSVRISPVIYLIIIFFVCCYLVKVLKDANREVQSLNLVILGFLGMIISVWTLFGCIVASDFQFDVLKFWPICSLLLLASFVFSINAWSCFFTGSYMLCEHRVDEDDLLEPPIDGIICPVVVRRNAKRFKHPKQLPTDFQFDDILDTSRLKYTKSDDVEFVRLIKQLLRIKRTN
ncbi:hypothetical protein B9Z55_016180 [Caenorhabditis nigoni]|uniref:Uncharacterized protein n=1 Tax=Caenorhabditis nigoni TaxID=1611254 RepID=A0A2G5UDJ5_9PELO|nr:hypothetical protein B9Z55_016180 [Caenorhabditis nigoni]